MVAEVHADLRERKRVVEREAFDCLWKNVRVAKSNVTNIDRITYI